MQKSALFPAGMPAVRQLATRLLALLGLALAMTGCSNFLSVYKADLNQGNVVTKEMVDKLKPGMTPSQVRYVLGTPLITDTLNPRRWDYLYDFTPGTYSRKAKMAPVDNRRMTVWFDNGVLSKIEGGEQMPLSNPSAPESKDKTLTADPL